MLRLRLESPCDASWSSLAAVREGERECGACERRVHDLTAVTEARARALIVLFATEQGFCGRARIDRAGLVVFDRSDPAPRERGATLLAAATVALAACGGAPTHEGGQPHDPRGPSAVLVQNCPPVAAAPQPAHRTSGDSRDRAGPAWMTQPDGDVDGDSIANGVDACPEERGEPNPVQGKNGCLTKVGGIGNMEIRIMEQPQFAPASSTPKISDRAMLDQIAAILKERPDIKKVIVAGHAAAGEANAASVSERRAERVVDELVKRGVDASRLEARGFGVDRPIASNVTQEGRAQNRRVEFEIVELSP